MLRLEIVGVRVGAPLGAACSSYVVHGTDATVLLDCGPGALDALWRSGRLEQLDAIVISHMHLDHMLDLVPLSGEITVEGLRERLGADPPRLPLYLPRGTGIRVLTDVIAALGSDPARLTDRFVLHEYDAQDRIEMGDLRLTFAETEHAGPCYAPRITDGAATVVYGADGALSPALVEHAAGADLVLLEATYLEPGPHLAKQGHMTGEQAAEVAARAGAGRLVLTHVMPFEEENAENLRRARARFDGPVDVAEPGSVYEL